MQHTRNDIYHLSTVSGATVLQVYPAIVGALHILGLVSMSLSRRNASSSPRYECGCVVAREIIQVRFAC